MCSSCSQSSDLQPASKLDTMFRATTASLCAYCQRLRLLPVAPGTQTQQQPPVRQQSSTPLVTVSNLAENQHTVSSLYDLSVDIRKVVKLIYIAPFIHLGNTICFTERK